MVNPTASVDQAQVDGMDVINDLATQLATALRDLAIQRAQIKVLKAAQVTGAQVTDSASS